MTYSRGRAVALSAVTGWTTVLVHGGDCVPAWQPDSTLNGRVNTQVVFDDGSGPALYVGGLFASAGGVPVSYVARWDGAAWSALDTGVNNEVYVLATFDDGNGPALYAGGVFSTAGGETVNRIAKWDGAAWSALGTGLNNSPLAMAVHDDGTGPALFVGGQFTQASGVTVNRIAKWDGKAWSPLGEGLNSEARSLISYDGHLVVGGTFTIAGGAASTSRIAAWDGEHWSSFDQGLGGTSSASVNAMAIYDDGCGPRLFVGGTFTSDGITTLNRLARWDGDRWRPLSSGASSTVYTMAVHDHGLGAGEQLFIGGSFSSVGGVEAHRIAAWNGRHFASLADGWSQSVFTILPYAAGGADHALFVGGWFSSWDAGSGHLATFDACPPVPLMPGDVDGDGIVGVLDLLTLLGQWGPCPDPCGPSGACIGDVDGDGIVSVTDLLELLAHWT